MKKKFVLTLALVLMVAASLVAATAVTVGGDFKASYKFEFASGGTTITAPNLANVNGGATANVGRISIATDFWKVTLRPSNASNGLFTAGDNVDARADIFLDKALAEQGVDMGDLTVKLSVGNYGTMSGLSVYHDPNGTYGDESYAATTMAGTSSAGVTVGYGSMVTVYAAFDPTATKDMVLSAKFAPVDGVSAAVSYANNYTSNEKYGSPVAAAITGKNAIGGSVAVDVKALADLDFDLKVSAIDVFYVEDEINALMAAVSTKIEDIAAYAEYQMFDDVSNLIAKVSFSGIENMGLYGKLELKDLADVKTIIGAGADYTMGGVKYALDAAYNLDTEIFSLTPSVKISF